MRRGLSAISDRILEELKQFSIFNGIPDQLLEVCFKRVDEIQLLKGELLFRRGESYHRGIYFVLSGTMCMLNEADSLTMAHSDAIGVTTFINKTMYKMTVIADSDANIVFVEEYAIYSLYEKSPEFRDRFVRLITERFDSLKALASHPLPLSTHQSAGSCMSSPVITIHNSKTVAEAAKMMADHNVNTLLIMNRKHVVKGLLTTRDLTQRYLANATELPDVALAENYANQHPLHVPHTYPIVETLAEMLRTGETYALVTRNSRPVGIISRSDIMMRIINHSGFSVRVSATSSVAELKKVVDDLPKIIESMMNSTTIFRELLPALSMYHRIIQKQAVELAKRIYNRTNPAFSPRFGDFCCITIGCLARREMTLVKNQNHALILSDKVTDSQFDDYAAFSKVFAETLLELGYADHRLQMSLLNPDMVKRISDWREYLSVNIHKSNEANIPYTRVLFDCERFDGVESLLWEFKDAIYSTVKEKSLLFGRLVRSQQAAKIPISQFGSFITESAGEFKDTLNLKENVLNFISYTTQALALNADLQEVNTVRRLESLRHSGGISEELTRETIAAYETVVDLLLHEQLRQVSNNETPSFRIDPSKLSMHAQERLKRAMNIVARFFGEGLGAFK